MTERWCPVVGWEDLYLVSDLGNVFSVRSNRNLTPFRTGKGYLTVLLYRDGQRNQRKVHHLVLLAFAGPCPRGQEVRHGLGGKTDNRLANLSYGTPKENAADKLRDGTVPFGIRSGTAKLTDEIVASLRARYAAGASCGALATEVGVTLAAVAYAVKGQTWAHVGAPIPERRSRKRMAATCP